MPFEVTVESSKAEGALSSAPQKIGLELTALIKELTIALRDNVRSNIQTQGQRFDAPWKPSSKWFQAKKGGNSKMFAGQEKNVEANVGPDKGAVAFRGANEWDLTKHDKGFTEPPTGEVVTILLREPAALGVSKSKFTFKSVRPSVVPARRMWPTTAQADGIATPLIESWAATMGGKIT